MRENESLSISELCAKTGKSTSTVYEWCNHKGLKRDDRGNVMWSDYLAWRDEWDKKSAKSFRRKMAVLKNERVNDGTPHVVYQIIDPKDGEAIYYGITRQDIDTRWSDHKYRFINGIHGNRQMMRLYHARIEQGFGELRIEPIQTCMGWRAGEIERGLIRHGRRRIGRRLCNVMDGGHGGKRSKEVIRRVSEAVKAKWQDPEYRAKCLASSRDRWEAKARAAGFDSVDEWRTHNRRVSRRRDRTKKKAAERSRRQEAKRDRLKLFQTLTLLTVNGNAVLPMYKGWRATIPKELSGWASGFVWHAYQKHGRWSPRANDGKRKIVMPQPYEITSPNGQKAPTSVPKMGI